MGLLSGVGEAYYRGGGLLSGEGEAYYRGRWGGLLLEGILRFQKGIIYLKGILGLKCLGTDKNMHDKTL